MCDHKLKWVLLPAILLASLLAGCGGGGGGGSSAPQALSKGVITAFGSVFVNGIEFDTGGASILMDDKAAVQGSLAVGMVVTVRGTWNDSTGMGTASSVIFRDDLQGFIETIDGQAGTFAVLGLTVHVDQNTRYEHTTGLSGASPLLAGNLVEVSGLPDGSGNLRATCVERKSSSEDVEIKGVVVGPPGAGSFTMSVPSNPSGIYTVIFTGSVPSGLGSGSLVEVLVDATSYVAGSHLLPALEIELEEDLEPSEGMRVRVEGYVTSYVSNAQFSIDGMRVDASGVSGMAGRLMNGVRVEIEGAITGGVLVAREVSFQTSSHGVISAMGSVILNGIEYDLGGSAITMDGASAPESSLSPGMVVEVRGKADYATGKGFATEVLYADELQGAVETIDPTGRTLVVLGVTVRTDSTTIYENTAGLASLAARDIVEVSGMPDPAGGIHATYIEKKPALSETEVKGTVSAWNGGSFDLLVPSGSPVFTVDASSIAGSVPQNFKDGLFVEVKASSFDTLTMTLVAHEIHVEDTMEPSDGEQVDIKGIISSYASTTQTFDVEGLQIDASDLSPAGLADGVEVEVEGTMVNGILVARDVIPEKRNTIEIEGDLESMDAVSGTLTVMGTTFRVSISTIFKDSRADGMGAMSLGDLAAGDHLEVAGRRENGSNAAALVERKEAAPGAMMAGPVSSFSDTAPFSLTILGKTIPLSPGNPTALYDVVGNPIDAGAFFAAITTPTTVVAVTWDQFVAISAAPDEAELESSP